MPGSPRASLRQEWRTNPASKLSPAPISSTAFTLGGMRLTCSCERQMAGRTRFTTTILAIPLAGYGLGKIVGGRSSSPRDHWGENITYLRTSSKSRSHLFSGSSLVSREVDEFHLRFTKQIKILGRSAVKRRIWQIPHGPALPKSPRAGVQTSCRIGKGCNVGADKARRQSAP